MGFEVFEPSSLSEAKEILRRGNGGYRVLAGGTDILLQIRRRVKNYPGDRRLVDRGGEGP
jgi:CO/xanthine dehydrogenase FAD-binding subunit